MTTWYKAGVCGDLQGPAQKCKGRIERVYGSIGEDLYITAIRDGNHSPGTFHEIGMAFDIRYGQMP